MQNEFSTPMPEPTKAQASLEKIANIINCGAQSVMISIGHRSGLFDVMSELSPSTSEEIAAAANLAERYVREWLAAMTTARIVNYDPSYQRYWLPPDYAACLSRNAQLGNMAVYAQMVPILGAIQDRGLHCFETGEGTSYDDYPCFHQFMSEDSDQNVVAPLFDQILPLVDGITDRLHAGIEVLDAGCGRARTLIAMAERFPASRFIGYDLCNEAVEHALNESQTRGLNNIHIEVRDMTGFEQPDQFDLITTFDAVHDQKDPEQLIHGLYRALKSDGAYLMQDIGGSAFLENNIDFPMASFLYSASCLHCTPISIGQGGQGLGTMWGWETAEKMLMKAGFSSIHRHLLEHDPMGVWFVSYKGEPKTN